MVVYTCNPRVWKSNIQGHPQLHNKTKAKLRNLRPQVKINKASEMVQQIKSQSSKGDDLPSIPQPTEITTSSSRTSTCTLTYIHAHTKKSKFLYLIVRKKSSRVLAYSMYEALHSLSNAAKTKNNNNEHNDYNVIKYFNSKVKN